MIFIVYLKDLMPFELQANIMDSRTMLRVDMGFYVGMILWAPPGSVLWAHQKH